MIDFGVIFMKHELLIPAGDMDCLRQAVFHGADAVYLACKNFGARKFATNFTNEEIIDAIRFCHLYGVKIYITMNTLIRDSEVDSFLEQAKFLHDNHVDALIVQDFGMICLLREMFPNLEIHASTQANNSSQETCQMFYDLGVKRVVFSRELSIDEIDSINVPIEKEAFIHGALCVSYSGCCLMSSMLGGRSGNRGECAGSCRLPYTLKKDGKILHKDQYLLSMKELNTSSEMNRLLNSSIYSFKVEGRMKGPLYVAFITEFYRKLIDGVTFSYEEELNKLKTIFNREFTLGHLFGITGKELINHKSPNHIGLEIGKAFVKNHKIKLELDPGVILHQHDSIRFLHSNKGMVVNYLYDKKDALCSSSSDVCFVDNKVQLEQDDILMKTQDSLLEKEYILDDSLRKVPITFNVYAKKNHNLKGTISDGVHSYSLESGMVQEAVNVPTSRDTILDKMSKLGNTPFSLQNIEIDMEDDVFIQIRMINDLRRDLVSYLISLRENDGVDVIQNGVSFESIHDSYKDAYSCMVYNEEQLQKCLELSFDRIYTPNKELFDKNKDSLYYFEGRCLPHYSSYKRNVVSDTFSYRDSSYGLYFLNVTNMYTAYYLKRFGLKNIPISIELNEEEVSSLINDYHEKFGDGCFELFAYGRCENMIIKDNILELDSHSNYQLIDGRGRIFPVYFDGRSTHVLNYEIFRRHYSIPNVTLFFDFYGETESSIMQIMSEYHR